MRILITTDVEGGVWSYTEELVGGLTARGHEVALVVLGREPEAARRSRLATAGTEVIELPCRLEWEPGAEADLEASVERLRRVVERISPDVVHLNQFYYGAFDLGAPRLVVAHSDVVSWWRSVKGEDPPDDAWTRRYRGWVRDGMRGAHLRVAPSRWAARQTESLYSGGPVRVIHNARSPERFRARRRGHREPVIAAAGRLWDEAKGVRDLIPVAERLESRARVVVAGATRHPAGGEDFPTDTKALEWAGLLDADELRLLLAQARIYAATSRYEPFGLAPLEAALAGCALVMSDIQTFRELWDGCAVYYPPGDVEALTEALESLLGDESRRRALADAARTRALERYSPERMAAEYEAVYRELARAFVHEPVVAD